ncbi:MAG: hypothetical protein PHS00_01640 [Candidatus Pacebacteria bacterium]|nr:hypothetical protein [Candidatus Paceibacterota bacterium]
MTNEPQNNDSYREIISEEDLGETSFPSFSQKEEVLPIEEVASNPAPTINLSSSIRDSAFKEEVPEIVKEETKIISDFTISEDLMGEPIKEEVPEVPQEPVKEELVQEPIKEEVPEIKEEVASKPEPIKEEVPEVPQEPVKEELVQEPIKEEVPEIKEEVASKPEPEPVLSYREVRDDLYSKISPRNIDRFKELGLEENVENKRLLDSVATKINFLDDDLEENAVSEKEALLKLKELQNLLTK